MFNEFAGRLQPRQNAENGAPGESMLRLPNLPSCSFAALAVAAAPLLAQTPGRDMRLDGPGGPLFGQAMRDQAMLGICDAEAATVLFDAELARSGVRQPKQSGVSAIFLMAKFADQMGAKDIDAPSIEQLLHGQFPQRFCSQDEVAEALKSLAPPESEMCFQALYTYRRLIRPGQRDEFAFAPSWHVQKWPTHIPSVKNCTTWSPQDRGGTENLQLLSLMLKRPLHTPGDFVRLVEPHCKTAVRMPRFEVKRGKAWEMDPKDRISGLQKALDATLDRGKPAAVKYCGRVLVDKAMVGVHPELGKMDGERCRDARGDQFYHVSAVVGRRVSHSGTQYLVRNSYGTSCAQYDKSFQCERGSVWIDAPTLLRNVSTVVGTK